MAEEIKIRFITGDFETEKSPAIKVGKNGERTFDRKEVEEVVKARLDEIFNEIRKKLKAAKYDQRLPEGIILTGGGTLRGVTFNFFTLSALRKMPCDS